MLTLKTLHCGGDQASTQFPIRNPAAAQEVTLVSGVEQVVTLAAGHYEIRAPFAFDYTHGAAAIAGTIRLPHDAGVWLGLSLDVAQGVALKSAVAGKVLIVPMMVA